MSDLLCINNPGEWKQMIDVDTVVKCRYSRGDLEREPRVPEFFNFN